MGRYLTKEPEIQTVTSGGIVEVSTGDIGSHETLSIISTTLKKIEYHLSIASDTNLNDQDV